MYRTIYSKQGGKIQLDGREVINMASNNYLGLASHPQVMEAAKAAIDAYGVGPTASRNIVGNFPVHDELEAALAKFKEVEATLVFNCGVSANTGVIPCLVGKGDTIYSDELNHGSIIDGCKLSGAKVKVFAHKDMASLEARLQEAVEGKKLIITDGVFSMDGDLAPLPEIAELAKKYDAMFMVDDAHGDGVMGPMGRGTVDYFGVRDLVHVETGSLSKAFGSAGGFVAGKKELIDSIRPKARSFIFTASPMAPCLAAGALEVIKMVSTDESYVNRLWENREYFVEKLTKLGLNLGTTITPIVPVIVGEAELAQKMSADLFEKGVFAQAICFPMVARDAARLRVILSAGHTKEDLDLAVNAIAESARNMGLI
ncbi:aminotransferase class I/II-fold pyridoxal phosphate-dependent enzyme [Chakrabartyella piscis]|uniref:aminotransferase class I/II-fold pyridoxal phosphate-dependent enzyme n=1 Tax=Chakrabartyella piscis TaxID=2918914 RepID=UPI00295897E5|nr:aminotransferase class I/II-fold pyridoxal phosphate-dependent enzyme [Chakrabartyella piscis]